MRRLALIAFLALPGLALPTSAQTTTGSLIGRVTDEQATPLAGAAVRIVRDEQSVTGWTQEVGPFQGWAEMPEW